MKNEIIKTIGNDLQIFPYDEENEINYCNRLIYSAVSEWLRVCILDKTNDDSRFKSKLYLRLRGEETLKSFLQIFPECNDYFYGDSDNSDKNPINIIRERMICNGELLETNDGISLPSGNLSVGNSYYERVLGVLNSNGDVKNVGITKIKKYKQSEEKTKLHCFDNEEFFVKYLKSITWEQVSQINGFEFLNPNINQPPYKCWQSLESMHEKTMYISKLHVNEYIVDYYWIKKVDGVIYISKVNEYYSEFKEIRRFILWQRKKSNNQIKAQYCKRNNIVILKLFAKIPFKEQSFLDIFCWPLNSIQNQTKYIIPGELWDEIKEIINSLDFILSEVDYGRI